MQPLIKSKWSKAYMDRLPDSAFLCVLAGGTKKDGFTEPRSKRKFPVRDKDGKIDKPHLDDALSRIPDSNLSDALKEKLTDRAESLLASWKKEHGMKKSVGSMSYNELRNELQGFVQRTHGKKAKGGDYYTDYPYVVDIYETEFVVEENGAFYIAEYAVDGVDVTIGDFYPAKKLYQATSDKAVKDFKGPRVRVGDVAAIR